MNLSSFCARRRTWGLDDDNMEVIRKKRINGRAFLKTSKEDFEQYGLEGGPATNLAECKENKLRSFSSCTRVRKT
jgi:hypothetical protein